MKRLLLIIFAFTLLGTVAGQPPRKMVEVRVTPLADRWEARPGEKIAFEVTVVSGGQQLTGVPVKITYGQEMMPGHREKSLTYAGKPVTIDAGSLQKPGFISCKASVEYGGRTYSGMANVGVGVETIAATTVMPADFAEFWNRQKAALASVPLSPVVTPLYDRQQGNCNVYHVSFQNERAGSRIYGILSVPKGEGPFPAILNVPGAGVRPYEGDSYLCNDGFISLTIGIHGLPVNLDREVYESLFKAGLDRYWMQGLEDRETYYYRRVYLGMVRAVDFLYTLPEFDKKALAISGGSQGGALAIVGAALDGRIGCYTAFYPALCDLTGYLYGQAGGWPAMFRGDDPDDALTLRRAEVSRYYDVVNFARILRKPGFWAWGYNDQVCPPTSVYGAYNATTAPKQHMICPDAEHWNYPEQWESKMKFIKDCIKERR